MNSAPSIIIGAGLSGLLAAIAWPRAAVFEAGSERAVSTHRALLRFRTDSVSRLTGIPFRRVLVRKGIWSAARRRFISPDIRSANLYARKCVGVLRADRSVWNVDPVERFVAPGEFYEELLASADPRISWEVPIDFAGKHREIIVSTAPMGEAMKALPQMPRPEFRWRSIRVVRHEVADADLHQTIYFPDAPSGLYRASFTGSTLIVESMSEMSAVDEEIVSEAFGLSRIRFSTSSDSVEQRFGKIVPLDAPTRGRILFALTHSARIYSLGRFATWRNILLDDVVSDIDVIKRLINSSSHDYDLSLQKGMSS